jgi:MFS family permease
MYAIVVALKPVAEEFGVSRGDASLAYTAITIGFGLGGIVMGRWSDRAGVMWPALTGTVSLAVGMWLAALSDSLWQLVAVHLFLIGLFGSGAFFSPLVADITHWFTHARGIAVAVVISGNYVAGVVWPPLVQHLIDAVGWREAYSIAGLACLLLMLPLCLVFWPRSPHGAAGSAGAMPPSERPLGIAPGTLQCLVCIAGIGCCVAMAMPQVHLVAYASDLGHAAARGAEMLALMLAGGVVSRLTFGAISDRVGGLATLVLGSSLQGLALIAFMFVEGLLGLYVMALVFGLSQGGIVPSYAIIVRTFFAPNQAGSRIGVAMLFTLIGMALGGWMAGVLYDLTGSYRASFVNAIAFNVANLAIAVWLLRRTKAADMAAA